ncbi:glycosyltransferase family protein [Ornithinimicrobium avium]|uniref:Glycosyltransferase n=1 Tax=Ornithinimicrobium avium TaxID=2283195 RepID=A0A345NPB3_9MICO|nr:glycosyltransferase [Ornithinimicrobium avium]AXH96871.1 glycosyltransferase [Ornithinimicrobium avium]
MIRVGIARPTRFYGPEIFALVHHFANDPDVRYVLVEDKEDLDCVELDLAHVVMGFEGRWRRARTPRIHDYSSLSTPPWAPLKDRIKRSGQIRPVLRSFLSCFVKEHMDFRDGCPWVLRDMGVSDAFFATSPVGGKEHDMGYAGSLTVARGLVRPLTSLAASGFRLLLVGEPDSQLRSALAAYPNVTFAGRLRQDDVPEALRTCTYGLNYVPPVTPYQHQTSTKVLEYSALGLKILTNDYPWVRRFQADHDARFAVLDPDRPPTPEELAAMPLRNADPETFRWSSVLEASGLRDQILRVVNGF